VGLGLEGLRRRRFGALGSSESLSLLSLLDLTLLDLAALLHGSARADSEVSVLASPGSGAWVTTSADVGTPTHCWIRWMSLTWCSSTTLRALSLRRTRDFWA